MEDAHKSIREALGGSLGDYHKSRDHMRGVFGVGSLADEAAKMINGPSARTEAEKYIGRLDERMNQEPVIRDYQPFNMPPNPIHQTNEHLADLGVKIDALVDLQAKQAEVTDKLLDVQIANEAAREQTDKRNLRLNVMNMVLAAIIGIGAIVVTVAFAG
jgi:hypothetical protein